MYGTSFVKIKETDVPAAISNCPRRCLAINIQLPRLFESTTNLLVLRTDLDISFPLYTYIVCSLSN